MLGICCRLWENAALLTGPLEHHHFGNNWGDDMKNIIDAGGRVTRLMVGFCVLCLSPIATWAATGDEATHEADHALDADIIELPEVHVHGLPLNKDQQVGPVPKSTPWPAVPSSLEGKPLDDWMKARLLVSKDAQVTVIVLEPAKHRELTIAGIIALNKWTFAPQLKGDNPVDGELTVRIHFRSQ